MDFAQKDTTPTMFIVCVDQSIKEKKRQLRTLSKRKGWIETCKGKQNNVEEWEEMLCLFAFVYRKLLKVVD